MALGIKFPMPEGLQVGPVASAAKMKEALDKIDRVTVKTFNKLPASERELLQWPLARYDTAANKSNVQVQHTLRYITLH